MFLEEIVSYAESAYLHISQRARPRAALPRAHWSSTRPTASSEQTNITLSELPPGVAAFAEPIQNRMVLPIDLPPDKLYDS